MSPEGPVSGELIRELAPVRWIETDSSEDAPRPDIALCLSGGGYRAMLFHLGGLWRLNELAYLPRLDRVSSVSGGSITAAVLAAAWPELDFDERGSSQSFEKLVVGPVRTLAAKTIDVSAVLTGLLTPGSIAERLAGRYDRILFRGKTLQDLPPPPAPLFVINATNVQSGVLWRFTRPYMWDYRVGKIESPTTGLAIAVAASSAFPPFLSPLVLRFDDSDYAPNTGRDLQRSPFTSRVVLSDGGVYDNLGLETAWKNHRTVLVSDAGGNLAAQERPSRFWPLHAMRTLFVIDNQVRSLRKHKLIASYKIKLADGSPLREGAYWGIRSDVSNYELSNPLHVPTDAAVAELAATPTRLKRLSGGLQERLINWGYLICDTAIRKHFDRGAQAPTSLPYPDSPIDP
jgi:NTE family protein